MLLLQDMLRWALPVFWFGVATAAFFTAQVLRAQDALFLLPLGIAALVLAAAMAGLTLLWNR